MNIMYNEEDMAEYRSIVEKRKSEVVATYDEFALANKLQDNLIKLSGGSYAYVAGYLSSVLALVAKRGINELIDAVDRTNQRVENNSCLL